MNRSLRLFLQRGILLVIALLLVTIAVGQSFDYANSSNGNLGIRSHITRPLARHMPLIFKFTMTIVTITGMVVAGRVYTLWQAGEENVTGLVSRWGFGLILVTALVWFLKEYFKNVSMTITPDMNF
ncbi:DUF4134 family protein [Persicitalea jodogahamensis]|uniref:Uncharacterized protein n=1 Tax=Persicitalea jodogahamensis TaxID=402147 RepID=A0A8J3GBJ1_9BACT|nr:DUF4134 family protein [Persicitalea jodogahamensis]GHB87371.1 hypothetical protein GCM10007390_49030 [Persicitalea jodogahamensis]